MEQQLEQENILPDIKNLDSGLEILVELAEKGEINPWDVDIIELTNKYLAALNSSPRENLLNAGRAIFYASVLLRMKSEILLNISNETLTNSQLIEDFFPEDEMLDDNTVHIDITKLDTFINRSSLGKHQRKRKILLSDLIIALQQAEEEEEKRAIRAKLRAERRIHYIIAPDMPDDVLEIAHEEDIEDIVERIESIVEEHLTDEKPITLSYLSKILNNKVKPFLALLFMAHSQKIVLEQKDIYGEIYVYKAGKITTDVLEQQEANEKAIKEEKERAKKAKQRKKNLLAKAKDLAGKVIEKITGETKKEDEEVFIQEDQEKNDGGNN